MQNKGIVKFIAIVLILVCCFYLSFSWSGVSRLNHERESVLRNLFIQAVPRDGDRPGS